MRCCPFAEKLMCCKKNPDIYRGSGRQALFIKATWRYGNQWRCCTDCFWQVKKTLLAAATCCTLVLQNVNSSLVTRYSSNTHVYTKYVFMPLKPLKRENSLPEKGILQHKDWKFNAESDLLKCDKSRGWKECSTDPLSNYYSNHHPSANQIKSNRVTESKIHNGYFDLSCLWWF